MGFFKDFKDDLNETVSDLENDGDLKDDEILVDDDSSDMVNTLDKALPDEKDPDLAQLAADLAKEAGDTTENDTYLERVANASSEADSEKTDSTAVVSENVSENESESETEDDLAPSDETAVITKGVVLNGDMVSDGSIDVYGKITGNVTCRGRLMVCGSVKGVSSANEVFANKAKIEGDIVATGSVKVGQGTVIIGNVSATTAVIAGAVKGNIDVQGPVVIDSTAVVVGDIKSKTVQINNGATIDGRCSQCYSDIKTDELFDI